MSKKNEILVIGGGVIGVCSAYYLTKQGFQVTLIDAEEICAGASYGNAGLILPSHIEPLASPGALGQGLRWLLNPESPFYIKPRLSLNLFSWLWRFRAASHEQRARASMGLLKRLSSRSVELYRELSSLIGMEFGYEEQGSLHLFKTEQGYADARAKAAMMRTFGIEARILNREEVHEADPRIRAEARGGLYLPHDAHLVPADFVVQLAKMAEDSGASIRTNTEVLDFEITGPHITAVRTTRGDFYPNQIVLAGGAWSPELSRKLHIRLPIQPAKGYGLTFRSPDDPPVIPMMLSEARVAITPMGRHIRFAGTLELAGYDLSVNQRRIQAIVRQAGEYLPWTRELELVEIWRGLRPCTPDGLPVIGRAGNYNNLIIAAGHATIGMVLGPVTGLLAAQLVSREQPEIDIHRLRLGRFS